MLATSFILSAIAAGQAFALPALQERQAVSSATSAIASATSAASSVASVASSSAASAVSSASSSVVSASSASSASASAPSASASNSYASGLLAAISARNAPALASLIAGSPQISQAVVSALSQTTQNFTLLAPSDAGLAAATANIDTSNTTLVTQLLTYHVLPGYYPAAYFGVNQTTILNTAANQNLVFYRNQYLTTNVVGGQNATVLANSTYQNVLIKLIDNALQLPANVSTTLGRTSSGTTLLQTIASTAPQLVNTVDTASAITVFAPSNQAFSNIQSAVNQLAGNPTQLQNVILGHVVAGQTLYSNAGPNNLAGNPTGIMSAANTTFTFATNATGTYVTSQGTTARVIQSNIITSNGLSKPGVIHVIDAVLVPAQATSSSASGAAAAPSSASASASAASSSASGAVSSASSAASSAASAASSAVASATSSA